MKPVLLIVIDALSSQVVIPAMEAGKLPTMKALSERGLLRKECVSIFPTITPAATASIVTGKYPVDHGIVGAFFYDTDRETVRYFGTDIWTILKEGFATYFNDFGIQLNETILQSETLFQIAAQQQRSSASLNYMVYHGATAHQVQEPLFIKMWPGVSLNEQVHGPDVMIAGDFVSSLPRKVDQNIDQEGGMFHRFGFQDDTTGEVLLEMIQSDTLVDFTLAYFPDNDFECHKNGPQAALPTLENVDRWLGKAMEAAGGIDNFLQRRAILILGDHSQCNLIADADSRAIDLQQILAGFDFVDAGTKWTDDNQLMICPNLRCAQIYLRRGYREKRNDISSQVLNDQRIDQTIWYERQDESTHPVFHVARQGTPNLQFRRSTDGTSYGRFSEHAIDDFGNTWLIEGDLATVDATIREGQLVYRSYPNALERIANSFHLPTSGDMWVTAQPGYEFVIPGESPHDGGSHGSLHESDSVTSVIAAGLPDNEIVPDPIRTVDIADICLQLLDIPIDRSSPDQTGVNP